MALGSHLVRERDFLFHLWSFIAITGKESGTKVVGMR